MKGKLVIGLTGGIASGKSAVLAEFRRQGAKVMDCDKITRETVRKGTPALAKVVKMFGRRVLKRDGSLNRSALSRIVFSDSRKRKALEAIIHPQVKMEVFKRLKKIRRGVVVVDVPLLFEAKWQDDFDKTIVVWAPEKTQAARLMRRNGFSRAQALKRIRAQMPLAQKRRMADFIINNSGLAADTRTQVNNFLDIL